MDQPLRPRVLVTGMKPSGRIHLGNFLGAIEPVLSQARQFPSRVMVFIADAHALTIPQDAKELRQNTLDMAATWLALGLDPQQSLFYRQSAVPEIFELAWVLACHASLGLLNRGHVYKSLIAANHQVGRSEQDRITLGLYAYPVLMAADILAVGGELVPVGSDQRQHLEMARVLIQRLNRHHPSSPFPLPYPLVTSKCPTLPGLDGRKMSKSYHNTIPLLADPATILRLVRTIPTDSSVAHQPKALDTSLVYRLYEALAPPNEAETFQADLQAGLSWEDAKRRLAALIEARFRDARQNYDDWRHHPHSIQALLESGETQARALAQRTLARVREIIGL